MNLRSEPHLDIDCRHETGNKLIHPPWSFLPIITLPDFVLLLHSLQMRLITPTATREHYTCTRILAHFLRLKVEMWCCGFRKFANQLLPTFAHCLWLWHQPRDPLFWRGEWEGGQREKHKLICRPNWVKCRRIHFSALIMGSESASVITVCQRNTKS